MPKEIIACLVCGGKREISDWQKRQPTYTGLCGNCARHFRSGENNPNWKGGKCLSREGYVTILIRPEDFFYPMAKKKGYVFEHRLVMAKHLGRCLQKWELVHHKNGVKADNRLDNLELIANTEHISNHNKGYTDGFRQGFIDGRSRHIQELLTEIASLKSRGRRE